MRKAIGIFMLMIWAANSAAQSAKPKIMVVNYGLIKVFDEVPAFIAGNSKPAGLSDKEIGCIEMLLTIFFDRYNRQQRQEDRIGWKEYRRQYFPMTLKNGTKEVWINCFCPEFVANSDRDWRRDLIWVHDGGNCFFNIRVNLDEQKVHDLSVNGEA
ncbi:hypothetical protein [Taibaiella koreensis]|uniref:hypothetical protein n=1 Tax=Taibaiella koreensis TaxID=1268548 RepID=UPI000E59AC4D|nr:hypothetical protein [Taibaiella koreensis]